MNNTFANDILFDDAGMLGEKFGKEYLTVTAENLSPDCNCSGYTSVTDCDNHTNFEYNE